MASRRDYYEVLGVRREADDEEITRAYRKMAMRYHPDRNVGDGDAEIKFKEAAEAYDVLRDPTKRQRYDRHGHAGLEGMGGASNFQNAQSVFDLFGDLFGDVFGRGRQGPQAGNDLQITVDVDLVEAFRGTKKTLRVPREENCNDCAGSGCQRGSQPSPCKRCNGHGVVIQNQGFFRVQTTCRPCNGRGHVIIDPCPACRGAGRVNVQRQLEVSIPPGVETGTRIRISGEGEAGHPGAPRGDLYVALRVREHHLFHRDGNHLVCQVPITFSQAALGAEIEVPTLDGPVKHQVKAGVQAGEMVRLVGRGMPALRGNRPGDLVVQVVVETPRSLSKRQEELFRELAELDHKHVSSQRKTFLDSIKDFFAGLTEPESTDKER